jgi:hypothetical protein
LTKEGPPGGTALEAECLECLQNIIDFVVGHSQWQGAPASGLVWALAFENLWLLRRRARTSSRDSRPRQRSGWRFSAADSYGFAYSSEEREFRRTAREASRALR